MLEQTRPSTLSRTARTPATLEARGHLLGTMGPSIAPIRDVRQQLSASTAANLKAHADILGPMA
eukprot:6061232-Alexandrium_andersonii.AAC.1